MHRRPSCSQAGDKRLPHPDDVQAIAAEIASLPHADEPCRFILARGFEVQYSNTLERLIREQAIQQMAQQTVNHGIQWPPSDPSGPLTLDASVHVYREMCDAIYTWNRASSDPSFIPSHNIGCGHTPIAPLWITVVQILEPTGCHTGVKR
jgi:hypothetical protein